MLVDIPFSLKIIQVVLISGIKFLFSVPLALGFGFSWWQTFLITATGGIAGVFVFYWLTPFLMQTLRLFIQVMKNLLGLKHRRIRRRNPKKAFTRRNRFIIHIRGRYGLFGIAFLMPVILSIPFGTILAHKYYHSNRFTLLILSLSVVVWSLLLIVIFFSPQF